MTRFINEPFCTVLTRAGRQDTHQILKIWGWHFWVVRHIFQDTWYDIKSKLKK